MDWNKWIRFVIHFQVLLHDLHDAIRHIHKNLSLKCDKTLCAKKVALHLYNVKFNL